MVVYEFEEIKSAIELDRTVASNVGWKSLISTPGNRKRLRIIVAIAFFSQWSGNGLVSYYLSSVFKQIGITSSTTQLLINGILQIWNLFWAVSAAFLCDRLGRRVLFLSEHHDFTLFHFLTSFPASAVGMLIFFTMQTVCSAEFAQHGTPDAAHAVVAFIFLFYASYE